jgi:hypothetical protein
MINYRIRLLKVATLPGISHLQLIRLVGCVDKLRSDEGYDYHAPTGRAEACPLS